MCWDNCKKKKKKFRENVDFHLSTHRDEVILQVHRRRKRWGLALILLLLKSPPFISCFTVNTSLLLSSGKGEKVGCAYVKRLFSALGVLILKNHRSCKELLRLVGSLHTESHRQMINVEATVTLSQLIFKQTCDLATLQMKKLRFKQCL